MTDDTGVGPAPAESVALWVKAVASMGPDELESFEQRTFATWDRVSLRQNCLYALPTLGNALAGHARFYAPVAPEPGRMSARSSHHVGPHAPT